MLPNSSLLSRKRWPPYESTITFCVYSFHPNRLVYFPPPPISRAPSPLHLEDLSLMDGFLSKGVNLVTTAGLSSVVHTEGKLSSSSFARGTSTEVPHQMLASAGLVPCLHFCSAILGDGFMAVMDLVDGRSSYHGFERQKLPQTVLRLPRLPLGNDEGPASVTCPTGVIARYWWIPPQVTLAQIFTSTMTQNLIFRFFTHSNFLCNKQ